MVLRSPRSWSDAADFLQSLFTDTGGLGTGTNPIGQMLTNVAEGRKPLDSGAVPDLNTRAMARQQHHAQRQDIQDQRRDVQRERHQARHDTGGGGRAGGIAANWRAAQASRGGNGGPGGNGGGNPMLSHPAVAFGRQMAGSGPGGAAADAIRSKVSAALGAKGIFQDTTGTWQIKGLERPFDPGRMMRDAAIRGMGPDWADRVNGADAAGITRFPSPADRIVDAIRSDPTGAKMTEAIGPSSDATMAPRLNTLDDLAGSIRNRLSGPQTPSLAQDIMGDVLSHVGQQRGLGSTPTTDQLVSAIRQQAANQAQQTATNSTPWVPNPNPVPITTTPTGQSGPLTQGQVMQQTPGGPTPAQISQDNRNIAALGLIPPNGQAVGSTTMPPNAMSPTAGTGMAGAPGYMDPNAAPTGSGGLVDPTGAISGAPANNGVSWDQVNAYDPAFDKYGQMFGVDPNILKKMMVVESGGISPEGLTAGQGTSIGVMQVKPDIWEPVAQSLGLPSTYSAEGQIAIAAAILGGAPGTGGTPGDWEGNFRSLYFPHDDPTSGISQDAYVAWLKTPLGGNPAAPSAAPGATPSITTGRDAQGRQVWPQPVYGAAPAPTGAPAPSSTGLPPRIWDASAFPGALNPATASTPMAGQNVYLPNGGPIPQQVGANAAPGNPAMAGSNAQIATSPFPSSGQMVGSGSTAAPSQSGTLITPSGKIWDATAFPGAPGGTTPAPSTVVNPTGPNTPSTLPQLTIVAPQGSGNGMVVTEQSPETTGWWAQQMTPGGTASPGYGFNADVGYPGYGGYGDNWHCATCHTGIDILTGGPDAPITNMVSGTIVCLGNGTPQGGWAPGRVDQNIGCAGATDDMDANDPNNPNSDTITIQTADLAEVTYGHTHHVGTNPTTKQPYQLGDSVTAGTDLGYAGGANDAYHIHVEVHLPIGPGGKYMLVDPNAYFNGYYCTGDGAKITGQTFCPS